MDSPLQPADQQATEKQAQRGVVGRLRQWLSNPRQRRMARGIGSTTISKGLSWLISLLTLPLAVRYLGSERYGVWVTISTTVYWLNIMDLGIASTLTNGIARAFAHDDKALARRYLTNAVVATSAIALLLGVVALVAWPWLHWARLFNVSSAVSAGELNLTVAIAGALMLLSLPASLGSKVLSGYQQTDISNYLSSAGALAGLLGLVGGIHFHVSMPVLFVLGPGAQTITSVLVLLWIMGWHMPWVRIKAADLSRKTMGELLSTGSSFFLLQIAGIIVFNCDNLVVGHYMGAAEVTPYSVTWRLIGYASMLQVFLFPSLWPAYAEADVRGDLPWIRRTFRASALTGLSANAVAVVLLVAFGRSIIRAWAGPEAVPTIGLLIAMAVWSMISSTMNIEACLLGATNQVRAQGVLSILAALANLALSIYLVGRIGALGVILGTIVSYAVFLVGPQTWIVSRYLRHGRPQPSVSAPDAAETR